MNDTTTDKLHMLAYLEDAINKGDISRRNQESPRTFSILKGDPLNHHTDFCFKLERSEIASKLGLPAYERAVVGGTAIFSALVRGVSAHHQGARSIDAAFSSRSRETDVEDRVWA